MKIIYLNKVHIDGKLPAVNFTLFNAYGFAQAGAKCYLMTQKDKEDFNEKTILTAFNLSPLDNLKLLIFPRKRYFGIQTNQWFYLKAYNTIIKIHKSEEINAIISRDPGALPYMARLRQKTGVSVFYQPHSFYVDLSIRPDVNPKNAIKYHFLEKKFIPEMTAVLCLQDSQAQWFRKYFPNQNILVAKPGLTRIKTSKTDRYKNRLIGYIGSLQLKKGVETLLEACDLLKGRGFKLLLIGGRDQKESETVRQRIRQLGLANHTKITGWIPFSEVEAYLEEISVGIIPLQDNFYNRYLTAPNKLFDYLSRGIPIVAADLPAIRDFLTENVEGKFFQPEQAKDLAKAIYEIFTNYGKYNQFSQNVLTTAKHYLWKVRATYMLKLIEEVIYE